MAEIGEDRDEFRKVNLESLECTIRFMDPLQTQLTKLCLPFLYESSIVQLGKIETNCER